MAREKRVCLHHANIGTAKPSGPFCNIPGGLATFIVEEVTCKVCLNRIKAKDKAPKVHFQRNSNKVPTCNIPGFLTTNPKLVTCKICLAMMDL